MVIVVSSGCVFEPREPMYARALAAHGIAALVVDSCTPRGVRSTVDDQARMTGWEVENDAWAALLALARDRRVDARRVGVMGVSKGGGVALNTAILARRRWQRDRVPPDLAFAAHVPIAPGCSARHRDARTTGAPMFFMMGSADDYTPASECMAYVDALRAAGNARIETRIYEGASHGWEWLGPSPRLLATAKNYSRCHAIIEDDGALTDSASGTRIPGKDYLEWARAHCMFTGNTHAGGGSEELRARATGDLVAFVRRAFGMPPPASN
jgi:dienelactone hydrolase